MYIFGFLTPFIIVLIVMLLWKCYKIYRHNKCFRLISRKCDIWENMSEEEKQKFRDNRESWCKLDDKKAFVLYGKI
jgi:hypothetical protein